MLSKESRVLGSLLKVGRRQANAQSGERLGHIRRRGFSGLKDRQPIHVEIVFPAPCQIND